MRNPPSWDTQSKPRPRGISPSRGRDPKAQAQGIREGAAQAADGALLASGLGEADGERIIVVFEGRDAAGKGGTIRAMTERVSPRTFRVVALPPTDREKSQMYVQRYLAALPGGRRDRDLRPQLVQSRRRRTCHGLLHQGTARALPGICPEFEKYIVDNGIRLIKYWLEVSNKEQKRRFEARIDDRLRQWKLSPMDLPSRERWYDYSRARDRCWRPRTPTCAVAHRALRRQEARAAQRHLAFP